MRAMDPRGNVLKGTRREQIASFTSFAGGCDGHWKSGRAPWVWVTAAAMFGGAGGRARWRLKAPAHAIGSRDWIQCNIWHEVGTRVPGSGVSNHEKALREGRGGVVRWAMTPYWEPGIYHQFTTNGQQDWTRNRHWMVATRCYRVITNDQPRTWLADSHVNGLGPGKKVTQIPPPQPSA